MYKISDLYLLRFLRLGFTLKNENDKSDRSLHIGSSDPTCVQKYRHVPLMVFEILGFKVKNKNKNWTSISY